MSRYRRWYVPGGTYFFTVVAYRRLPIFREALARDCLHRAIAKIQRDWPFGLVAIVLLPDHLHAVWTLPRGDDRYSIRWKRIKEVFTREYLEAGGRELRPNASRKHQGECGIWQRRFWEHTVEDEDDLKRCVDYVHYNPKKHGYVTSVRDWRWSSFHRFVSQGEYEIGWGSADPTPGYDAPEWVSSAFTLQRASD
jgi:putative transposase